MFKILLKAEALEDVKEVWIYYEGIQVGLGDRFMQSFDERLSDLKDHPTHYGYLHFDPRNIYRSVLLKRFPFRGI